MRKGCPKVLNEFLRIVRTSDTLVPEQKQAIARAIKALEHARRVRDLKSLEKAIEAIVREVVRNGFK